MFLEIRRERGEAPAAVRPADSALEVRQIHEVFATEIARVQRQQAEDSAALAKFHGLGSPGANEHVEYLVRRIRAADSRLLKLRLASAA